MKYLKRFVESSIHHGGAAAFVFRSTLFAAPQLLPIWENWQEDIAGSTQLYHHSYNVIFLNWEYFFEIFEYISLENVLVSREICQELIRNSYNAEIFSSTDYWVSTDLLTELTCWVHTSMRFLLTICELEMYFCVTVFLSKVRVYFWPKVERYGQFWWQPASQLVAKVLQTWRPPPKPSPKASSNPFAISIIAGPISYHLTMTTTMTKTKTMTKTTTKTTTKTNT